MEMSDHQKTLYKNLLQFVTARRILSGILSRNLENYEQSQNLWSNFFIYNIYINNIVLMLQELGKPLLFECWLESLNQIVKV